MVDCKLALKTYPSLIRLDAKVEHVQVNKTLRVKYTIPSYKIDMLMLKSTLGHKRIQHDDLEDISIGLVPNPNKFSVTIEGKLYSANKIRFRDFYIDRLKSTYVFSFGFQRQDFVRAYALPKGSFVINKTTIPDIMQYIKVRVCNRRVPLKFPKVVAKNLGRH